MDLCPCPWVYRPPDLQSLFIASSHLVQLPGSSWRGTRGEHKHAGDTQAKGNMRTWPETSSQGDGNRAAPHLATRGTPGWREHQIRGWSNYWRHSGEAARIDKCDVDIVHSQLEDTNLGPTSDPISGAACGTQVSHISPESVLMDKTQRLLS